MRNVSKHRHGWAWTAAVGGIGLVLLTSPVRAEEAPLQKWHVGANVAGINTGIRFSSRWSTEFRAQYLSKIFVGGFRENFHFRIPQNNP